MFEVSGEPVPFARAGSNGKRRFTPPRQAAYMEAVQWHALKACRTPLDGPLSLQIIARYTKPKSWTKVQRESTFRKASVPDADNLAKLIADSLRKIVYADDAQIAKLEVSKHYTDDEPGVTVRLARLSTRGAL